MFSFTTHRPQQPIHVDDDDDDDQQDNSVASLAANGPDEIIEVIHNVDDEEQSGYFTPNESRLRSPDASAIQSPTGKYSSQLRENKLREQALDEAEESSDYDRADDDEVSTYLSNPPKKLKAGRSPTRIRRTATRFGSNLPFRRRQAEGGSWQGTTPARSASEHSVGDADSMNGADEATILSSNMSVTTPKSTLTNSDRRRIPTDHSSTTELYYESTKGSSCISPIDLYNLAEARRKDEERTKRNEGVVSPMNTDQRSRGSTNMQSPINLYDVTKGGTSAMSPIDLLRASKSPPARTGGTSVMSPINLYNESKSPGGGASFDGISPIDVLKTSKPWRDKLGGSASLRSPIDLYHISNTSNDEDAEMIPIDVFNGEYVRNVVDRFETFLSSEQLLKGHVEEKIDGPPEPESPANSASRRGARDETNDDETEVVFESVTSPRTAVARQARHRAGAKLKRGLESIASPRSTASGTKMGSAGGVDQAFAKFLESRGEFKSGSWDEMEIFSHTRAFYESMMEDLKKSFKADLQAETRRIQNEKDEEIRVLREKLSRQAAARSEGKADANIGETNNNIIKSLEIREKRRAREIEDLSQRLAKQAGDLEVFKLENQRLRSNLERQERDSGHARESHEDTIRELRQRDKRRAIEIETLQKSLTAERMKTARLGSEKQSAQSGAERTKEDFESMQEDFKRVMREMSLREKQRVAEIEDLTETLRKERKLLDHFKEENKSLVTEMASKEKEHEEEKKIIAQDHDRRLQDLKHGYQNEIDLIHQENDAAIAEAGRQAAAVVKSASQQLSEMRMQLKKSRTDHAEEMKATSRKMVEQLEHELVDMKEKARKEREELLSKHRSELDKTKELLKSKSRESSEAIAAIRREKVKAVESARAEYRSVQVMLEEAHERIRSLSSENTFIKQSLEAKNEEILSKSLKEMEELRRRVKERENEIAKEVALVREEKDKALRAMKSTCQSLESALEESQQKIRLLYIERDSMKRDTDREKEALVEKHNASIQGLKLEHEEREQITKEKMIALSREKENLAGKYATDVGSLRRQLEDLSRNSGKQMNDASNQINDLQRKLREAGKDHERTKQALEDKALNLEESHKRIRELSRERDSIKRSKEEEKEALETKHRNVLDELHRKLEERDRNLEESLNDVLREKEHDLDRQKSDFKTLEMDFQDAQKRIQDLLRERESMKRIMVSEKEAMAEAHRKELEKLRTLSKERETEVAECITSARQEKEMAMAAASAQCEKYRQELEDVHDKLNDAILQLERSERAFESERERLKTEHCLEMEKLRREWNGRDKELSETAIVLHQEKDKLIDALKADCRSLQNKHEKAREKITEIMEELETTKQKMEAEKAAMAKEHTIELQELRQQKENTLKEALAREERLRHDEARVAKQAKELDSIIQKIKEKQEKKDLDNLVAERMEADLLSQQRAYRSETFSTEGFNSTDEYDREMRHKPDSPPTWNSEPSRGRSTPPRPPMTSDNKQLQITVPSLKTSSIRVKAGRKPNEPPSMIRGQHQHFKFFEYMGKKRKSGGRYSSMTHATDGFDEGNESDEDRMLEQMLRELSPSRAKTGGKVGLIIPKRGGDEELLKDGDASSSSSLSVQRSVTAAPSVAVSPLPPPSPTTEKEEADKGGCCWVDSTSACGFW